MVANRDAETAGKEHDEEQGGLKPIEAKMIKVERDNGER